MQAHPRPRPSCSGVLPNFCTIGTLFGVVLVVQLLVFVLLLTMGWPEGQVWERLSLLSLLAQWIALGTTALLCLLRRPLRRLGDSGEGLAAWLLLMGITAVALEVVATLGATWPGVLFSAREDRWGLLLRGLGISGILGAMVLRYFYLHHQWQRQQIARAEALFQALQARIRPHFLFNSMNTIASLTRSDPALAEAVVEDLADLFRAALSDAAGQSSLGRELELARGYLRVEQLRLDERLQVEWDLEELPEEAPLPMLTLQPLLENAVYHGVEPLAHPGVIRIAGRYRSGRVNLSVRNSLPPPDSRPGHREGNRIALENVRQRLLALYPDRASLSLGRVEDEFQVRLVFPYP